MGKEQHIGSVALVLIYLGEEFRLLRANLSSLTFRNADKNSSFSIR